MLARMTSILDGLLVYPERMLQNMGITQGLVFSQAVLLALTGAGLTREEAYEIVQRNAMRTWAGEGTFRELLEQDAELTRALSAEELDRCFDPTRFLSEVDTIFERVFAKS